MNLNQLSQEMIRKQSFLCVGLDTDIQKIPKHLLKFEDPVFEFNKQIIDATKDYCVAYKPNIAFYEKDGITGWESLRKTIEYIPKTHFSIADAKRGDIGNTSQMYANCFFRTYNFDSVTVNPYMGNDSVSPFLSYQNKITILLALTSNAGSKDFEMLQVGDSYLFEKILEKSKTWATSNQLMYVIGATQANYLERVRKIVPEHFLLIPGLGAQGGDLEDVCKYGMNESVGILVNSSRAIIYASGNENFAEVAGEEAAKVHTQMKLLMKKYL